MPERGVLPRNRKGKQNYESDTAVSLCIPSYPQNTPLEPEECQKLSCVFLTERVARSSYRPSSSSPSVFFFNTSHLFSSRCPFRCCATRCFGFVSSQPAGYGRVMSITWPHTHIHTSAHRLISGVILDTSSDVLLEINSETAWALYIYIYIASLPSATKAYPKSFSEWK
jgi:hypothetical protein